MTKLDAAYQQLRRAFILFAHDRDYVSAITLAGAADDILGKMVRRTVDKSAALENQVDVIRKIVMKRGHDASEKDIRDGLLYPRNAMKHLRIGDREDLEFDLAKEAESIIDRGVSNFLNVTGKWPDDPAYYDYLKERKRLGDSYSGVGQL
jgi:hypothetical protein